MEPNSGEPDSGADEADALSLLAADHRQVEAWFTELQSAGSMRREEELAFLICDAIRQHVQTDKSVVYPAFLAATGDAYRCQAALDEERDILELIDEIELSAPTGEGFFPKIHILCLMFTHHVQREEKERGVFAEVQHSGADLASLGQALQRRKLADGRPA